MEFDEIVSNGYEDDDEKNPLGQLSEILLNTQEQCQMVESFIKSQIEVKDKQIDKLYSELEFYKKESEDRFIDQVMKSIIKVRKDLARRIGADDWQEMSVEQLRREYVYVFEDMTDLLEQQNIDAFTSKCGDLFDASIHQAKVEITDNIELDKTVKCSLSEGYTKGTKVIIPERVIVYQYK